MIASRFAAAILLVWAGLLPSPCFSTIVMEAHSTPNDSEFHSALASFCVDKPSLRIFSHRFLREMPSRSAVRPKWPLH